MPNTGMLDHWAYHSGQASNTHWMSPWPLKSGYQSVRAVRSARVVSFSRYLSGVRPHPKLSRPASSTPRLAMENSISPFHTALKPTCGFFFSRETNNRKQKIGIPPSDLVSWRSLGTTVHMQRGRTA